ncbi:MAG TPA: hypothetical protein VGC91_14260 [Pyrinomonadaceae bacterium]
MRRLKKLPKLTVVAFTLLAFIAPATTARAPVATQAVGYIDLSDIPNEDGTFNVGDGRFQFTDQILVATNYIQVSLAGNPSVGDMADRIAAAINLRPRLVYCSAVSDGVSRVTLTATDAGSAGNSIPLESHADNLSVTPFDGGSD